MNSTEKKYKWWEIVIATSIFIGICSIAGGGSEPEEPMHGRHSRGPYVGSINSNKYHITSCKWAKEINESNAISWETEADARYYGYIPCKVCEP